MKSAYDYCGEETGEPLGYWRRISCLWSETLRSVPDPDKPGYRIYKPELTVFSSFTGDGWHGREGERYTEWGFRSSETPLLYDYIPCEGRPCEHAQWIPLADRGLVGGDPS